MGRSALVRVMLVAVTVVVDDVPPPGEEKDGAVSVEGGAITRDAAAHDAAIGERAEAALPDGAGPVSDAPVLDEASGIDAAADVPAGPPNTPVEAGPADVAPADAPPPPPMDAAAPNAAVDAPPPPADVADMATAPLDGPAADAPVDAAPAKDSAPDTTSGPDTGAEAGPPSPACRLCPDGQKFCNGQCVSPTNPVLGCGHVCFPCRLANAVSACAADGRCVLNHCQPGFDDCNKDPSDGCEADLSAQDLHRLRRGLRVGGLHAHRLRRALPLPAHWLRRIVRRPHDLEQGLRRLLRALP